MNLPPQDLFQMSLRDGVLMDAFEAVSARVQGSIDLFSVTAHRFSQRVPSFHYAAACEAVKARVVKESAKPT